MEFTQYLDEKREQIENALEHYLPQQKAFPALIHESMRYSIFAGGKRLRPIMTLMAAELLGNEADSVLFAAVAVEMIHTYSLIHDDLPVMDNDDLRRGKPTNHKVYGEDVAILAGDALLTLAFQVMAAPGNTAVCEPTAILQATHELGLSAGSLGMIGGQMMDMQAEEHQISREELAFIHAHKTGKMIATALRIGAILSSAAPQELQTISEYGERIGQAFQIVDDILDIEGEVEKLGKNVKSDLQKHKATYPAMYGIRESKQIVEQLIEEAKTGLDIFGQRAEYFKKLADFMISRTY